MSASEDDRSGEEDFSGSDDGDELAPAPAPAPAAAAKTKGKKDGEKAPKERKPRAVKKPKIDTEGRPKKARTPYMIYSQEVRLSVIAANPHLAKKVSEQGKHISNMWKALSEAEKEVYKKKYEEEKKRVAGLMKEWEASHPGLKEKLAAQQKEDRAAKKGGKDKAAAGAGKRKRDASEPKGAKGAFMFFMDEQRAELKKRGITGREVTKVGGQQWKALAPEDKAKYEKLAAEDKKRHEEQLRAAGKEPPSKSRKKASGAAASGAASKAAAAAAKRDEEESEDEEGEDDALSEEEEESEEEDD